MIQSLLTIPGDADTRRRGQAVVSIASLLFVANLVRTPAALYFGAGLDQTLPATVLGSFGTVLCIWLARSGKTTVGAWTLIVIGVIAVSVTPLVRGELIAPVMLLCMPVFLAGLMLRPWQVPLAVGLALTALAVIAQLTTWIEWRGSEGPFVFTLATLIILVGIISLIGARVNTQVLADAADARQAAEVLARRLEELNGSLQQEVDARTLALRQALTEVQARAEAQAALLAENEGQRAAMRQMSVPVLPVSRDTLVLPLVGSLDRNRLADLQAVALDAIEHSRTRTVLLDITGVPVVDAEVAEGLIATVQAVRLLGAEPVLIGVCPEVAQALVALGIDLAGLRTAADLESALGC